MEDVSALAIGCVVGLLVIGVVNAFPGEPFDYDKDLVPPSNAPSGASSTNSKSRVARAREVDLAASQLKVQKLQELLGLEKSEVQKMIDQAKDDAINGRHPRAPVNYSKWLDMVFYGVVLALMVVVLRAEYSVDVFQLLASWFPREAETVNKVAAVLRSPVVWWSSWNS